MRIGIGYDIHRLVRGRPLILGGVKIDSEWGLEGHSDADVLLHAIGDALLGALALGDLGQHFPDTDPRYQGIASAKLLETIVTMVHEQAYRLHNLDTVVDRAKTSPRRIHPRDADEMSPIMLATDFGSISVKAKTAESLGALGRGEGIAVHAVCLITHRSR